MMFTPFIVTAALLVAPDADVLRVEQTYFGLNRPILVEVSPRNDAASVQLVLMDAQGDVISEAAVRPGRTDLAELFPPIWEVRQTSYLQIVHDGSPLGSALVVQPLLAPMTPVVQVTQRPDGGAMTRIVGWRVPGDESQGNARAQRTFTGFRIYPERDVVLHTSKGSIRLAMRPDEAPNTVWNFLELVRGGFYREVIFHRIVPLDAQGYPFVLQAGDPTGTGRGGPGYALDLEPSTLEHAFGVISMARADDPNSAGSQFFICLSRAGTARLDGQYAAFGYAVEGTETILALEAVRLADPRAGRPVDPPVIRRGELVPSPPRIPGRGRPDDRITRPVVEPDPHPGRIPR